jgi:hypothetical protein
MLRRAHGDRENKFLVSTRSPGPAPALDQPPVLELQFERGFAGQALEVEVRVAEGWRSEGAIVTGNSPPA